MRICRECRMPWPAECLCDDDEGAGVDWSADSEDEDT